jgi:diguanylate cyclase
MNHYNLKLIALSMLLGYFAIFLTFSAVRKLYRSQADDRVFLLTYSSLALGTSLWVIQFLNLLAFPVIQSARYAIGYAFLSWLAALIFAVTVLHVSSQKTLPLKSLSVGGFLAGIITFIMFAFSIPSVQIPPVVTFSPNLSVLAITVSVAVTTISIMILFWLKNYSGEYPAATKSIFAIIISLAITSVHLTYSATIETPLNAISGTPLHFNNTLVGITVALGLICLLLVLFIIAIFYDKLGYDTFKFNLFKKDDLREISQQALVDTLTQLPNRRALMQHLESATKRCERSGTGLAVAFIDVDNFKQINDSLGHKVGDQILQKISSRLVTAVRGCDEVARIGGDEFIAIIEGVENTEDYIAVAERMVSSVRAACLINNQEMNLSVSIGVAMHSVGGSIEQLISAADIAMYRAKKDGKNQFRFFDAEIALATDQLLEIQYDLKNALANDELKLHFQIKVDSVTREPVGAEALLRWQHPVRGLLHPADFMHAADRFGLSYAISDWVIEESCRTLRQLNYLHIPFDISINLSHNQIANTGFVSDVTHILKRFDLPTSCLIFDLTESAALKNQTQFSNQLARFKEAGIRVAIDDFGTFSSSITNLQNWQVSELKLDPAFTADINSNHKTRGIVQAVIELAHVLELNVVAEGVETEGQRRVLAELGCDQMQGFLISRPLPEERLINLLKNLSDHYEETGQFFIKELKHS